MRASQRQQRRSVAAAQHLVGRPADDLGPLAGVTAGIAQLERLAVGGGDPQRPHRPADVLPQ
jgi:hypothetical protein